MKFGVVNKSTTVNRFVLHSLQRNITHLAVITGKTNINFGILKGGKLEKSPIMKTKYNFQGLFSTFPRYFFSFFIVAYLS